MRIIRTAEERATARSAPAGLYGDASGGPLSIVPSLDRPRSTSKDVATSIRTNPLTMGPIWRLAFRIGALPLKVYAYDRDGVKEERPAHPAYTLLRKPNPSITRNLLISSTVVSLFTQRKAAWLKIRNSDGTVGELWPIYGSLIRPKRDNRTIFSGFEIATAGRKMQLDAADVCYFRLVMDPDDFAEGLTPFDSLRTVAGLGETAISAGDDMFRNGLLSRQWIHAKRELSTRALNRLRRQMEEARQSRYKVPVLEEDMELKDIQGPTDAVIVSAISLAAKIARETVGLPEDSSNDKAFFSEAVQPIADAIEQELERSLMPEFEESAFPEFGFREATRGDPQSRAQSGQTRILSAQATPNEIRREDNLPPLEGGDQLFVPLNLVPVTDTADDGVPEPKDSSGGLGGDEGKGTLASVTPISRSAYRAAAQNWGRRRERIIRTRSEQLSRRLRGLVNRELKALKAEFSSGRAASTSMPTTSELLKIVRKQDADVEKLLRQYMSDVGDSVVPDAAKLVDAEVDVEKRVAEVFKDRAKEISKTFGAKRAAGVERIVKDGFDRDRTGREIAEALSARYGELGTQFADGLARTEIAFAHEQAALLTWADAGIRQMQVMFGGGPCSTDTCEEVAAGGPYRLGEGIGNVGASFDGADSPPIHPGCTCFAVPFVEQD